MEHGDANLWQDDGKMTMRKKTFSFLILRVLPLKDVTPWPTVSR